MSMQNVQRCQNLGEKILQRFLAAAAAAAASRRQCSMSSGTALVLHISRHAAVSLPSVCRHNQHAKSKYPKLFYLLYLYVFKAFDIHIYFFNPLIINQETCEQLCLWSRISERKMLSIALVLYKAQQPLGTRHGLCHVCTALFPCSRR